MSAYSDLILADSPRLYYRMGEALGTTCTDASGYAGGPRNGTYVGSPTLAAEGLLDFDADTAVTFNGSSQYVDLGGSIIGTVLNGASACTIEAWVKPNALGANDAIVREAVDATNVGINLFVSSTAVSFSARSVSGDTARTVSVSRSVLNRVSHIVGQADFTNDQMFLYVDGVDVLGGASSQAFNNNTYTKGTPTYNGSIGANIAAAVGNYFNGTIDEVAVYGSKLSAATILQHYQAGIDTSIITQRTRVKSVSGYYSIHHLRL